MNYTVSHAQCPVALCLFSISLLFACSLSPEDLCTCLSHYQDIFLSLLIVQVWAQAASSQGSFPCSLSRLPLPVMGLPRLCDFSAGLLSQLQITLVTCLPISVSPTRVLAPRVLGQGLYPLCVADLMHCLHVDSCSLAPSVFIYINDGCMNGSFLDELINAWVENVRHFWV